MRRPSSPKSSVASTVTEPSYKRPRVAKNLKVRVEDPYDSDADMSTTTAKTSIVSNMSITSTVSEAAKTRTRKKKGTVEPCEPDMTTDADQAPIVVQKPIKTRTRAQKKAAAVKVTEVPDELSEVLNTPVVVETVKPRQNNNKAEAVKAEVAVSHEVVKPKRLRSTMEIQDQPADIETLITKDAISEHLQGKNITVENMEVTTQVKETNSQIVVQKVVSVTLQRLPDNLSSTVNVTPSGTILNQEEEMLPEDAHDKTKVRPEDMEITMAALKGKTPVTKEPPSQVPSTGLDLVAL